MPTYHDIAWLQGIGEFLKGRGQAKQRKQEQYESAKGAREKALGRFIEHGELGATPEELAPVEKPKMGIMDILGLAAPAKAVGKLIKPSAYPEPTPAEYSPEQQEFLKTMPGGTWERKFGLEQEEKARKEKEYEMKVAKEAREKLEFKETMAFKKQQEAAKQRNIQFDNRLAQLSVLQTEIGKMIDADPEARKAQSFLVDNLREDLAAGVEITEEKIDALIAEFPNVNRIFIPELKRRAWFLIGAD